MPNPNNVDVTVYTPGVLMPSTDHVPTSPVVSDVVSNVRVPSVITIAAPPSAPPGPNTVPDIDPSAVSSSTSSSHGAPSPAGVTTNDWVLYPGLENVSS